MPRHKRLKNLVERIHEQSFVDILSDLNNLSVHLNEKFESLVNVNETIIKELEELKKSVAADKILYINPQEVLVKTYNGLKIYIDPRDISVAPHMALDGIYESSITKAWVKLLGKQKLIIFDIGANFGYYGALAAQQLHDTKSHIVFFEANTNLIPYISKTLSVNWLNQVSKVENLGISDKSGRAKLSVLKDYIGSSSLHSPEYSSQYLNYKMKVDVNETVVVNTISIDTYCFENNIKEVDLIKMDIEGFEEKAYAGMKKIVESSPNLIFFVEFTKDGYLHPEEFFDQMMKDFRDLYLIGDDGSLFKPKNPDYNSVIETGDDWTMLVFSNKDNLDKR